MNTLTLTRKPWHTRQPFLFLMLTGVVFVMGMGNGDFTPERTPALLADLQTLRPVCLTSFTG